MQNYAIVEISGKQYKVVIGRELLVDRLNQSSVEVVLNKVLLLAENGTVKVGDPYVSGAKVLAKVLGEEKGDKIHVRKYKAKSRYRRHTGFRAKLTRIKIEKISASPATKKISTKKK